MDNPRLIKLPVGPKSAKLTKIMILEPGGWGCDYNIKLFVTSDRFIVVVGPKWAPRSNFIRCGVYYYDLNGKLMTNQPPQFCSFSDVGLEVTEDYTAGTYGLISIHPDQPSQKIVGNNIEEYEKSHYSLHKDIVRPFWLSIHGSTMIMANYGQILFSPYLLMKSPERADPAQKTLVPIPRFAAEADKDCYRWAYHRAKLYRVARGGNFIIEYDFTEAWNTFRSIQPIISQINFDPSVKIIDLTICPNPTGHGSDWLAVLDGAHDQIVLLNPSTKESSTVNLRSLITDFKGVQNNDVIVNGYSPLINVWYLTGSTIHWIEFE